MRSRAASGLRFAPEAERRSPVLASFIVWLAAPLAVSGLIRSVTSLALAPSLVLAIAIGALLVGFCRPWLSSRLASLCQPSSWPAEIASLVLLGSACWALYARDFGGFPNLDGWDGGTHVLTEQQFALLTPSAYNGQVTYYALAWWLERFLGLDSFRSFTSAFYLGVIAALALAAGIPMAMVGAETVDRRSARMAGIVLTAISILAIDWLVWLPLLHYNQAAGYYAHVFGLWPLMAVWTADALLERQAVRMVAVLLSLVALRYSYALNLADAFMAAACIVLLEGFRGKWRLAQLALVGGLAGTAWLIFVQLRPVFRIWGGIQRFAVDDILAANLLIAAAAVLYTGLSLLRGTWRDWRNDVLVRLLRFPIFFVLAGQGFLAFLRRGPGVKQYYVTKYPVWGCMLAALVLVILVVHLVLTLAQRGAFRRWSVWLRVALVAGTLVSVTGVWQKTFAGYRETFHERLAGHGPPYRFLRPLADPATIARIKQTLAQEKKVFGGYLTAFFPMFSFMNATLGYHTGQQDFFPPLATPGHCVFWVTRERDVYRLGPAEKIDAYRAQLTAAGATCSPEYAVAWKSTPQSLCYRCY